MASSGLEQIVLDEHMKSPDIFAPLQNENPELEPSRALFHDHTFKSKSHNKLQETPTDTLTGMPLPVLPPNDLERYGGASKTDWHHHYHPSNHNLLTVVNGLAVRNARLQLLPAEAHHRQYHKIFEGPPLPKTNAERFGQIVLAVAGYVPPKAIDVYKDDPSEPVEISGQLRFKLQTSGEIQFRGNPHIREFVKKYLIKQDLSHVDDLIIEEFITTSKMDRKRYLGHWLLAMASEVAVEPIKPIYKTALEDGGIVKPASKLPNIVKSQIGGRKRAARAINGLHKQLQLAHQT